MNPSDFFSQISKGVTAAVNALPHFYPFHDIVYPHNDEEDDEGVYHML